MAEPLDRILIQLGIDTDKLHQDASKVESTVENLKSKIIGIGTTIAAALGITNFVNEAVSSFTQLDKTLRETQVISNGTSDVFGEMKKQLMDLAESSRFSTNELASSLKSIVDAGYEGQDAMKVLTESVRLATSTGEDLGSTVKALLDNLNMLGVSADSAGEYANKLFVTMNLGRDSVSETSRAITSLIPLAQQLGISYDEVASALGVLSNKGLDSTSAAMSLRNALVSVLTPTDQMKKLANDLGVELSTSALQSKGLADYLGELATATQGNTEAINTFFGGARNMTAVLALASNNAQDFKNALDTMKEGTTALDNAFAVTSKSLDTQIQAMKNSIQNLAIAFGEAIQPMIKGLTDFISGFADWVREAPAWQKAIMGVGLALASLVPIIKGVSTAVAVMKGLFTGGMGLAQILTTAGVAVAGMTAIFGSLEYQTKKTNEAISKTGDALKEVGGSAQATSIENVISGFQQVNTNAQNTVKTVNGQMSALRRLIQLVTDYNYAQRTGLGDTEAIKKEIEDILAQYPTLNSAVLRTADGYALQVDNVKAIANGLLKTLEIEKQKLNIQLQELEAQKKMVERYDTLKKQASDLEKSYIKISDEVKNLPQEQVQIVTQTWMETPPADNTVLPVKPIKIDVLRPTLNYLVQFEKLSAVTKQLAEYEPYKTVQPQIDAQIAATKKQIASIDTAINDIKTGIQGITKVMPTYEKTINNLKTQVDTFKKSLESAKKANNYTEVQAIGKILDDLYSQLINYYEQSANNLATLGKTAEAINAGKTAQAYRDARTELQKQMEGISTTTTDVLKELKTTINAISTAIKAGNEEIAKRLYETAKSQYMDLLIKQYRGELEQSTIKELDGLKKSIDGYTTRFTTDQTSELKKQIETLTSKTVKEIEQNEGVYEEALSSLLNQIQNGMVEAYIAGDTKTFDLLKGYQTQLNKQWQDYLNQQANTMMKAIASMISQLQTIDISKGILNEEDLAKLEQVKKQFEGIDLSRAGKLGLTAEVDKLRESLQRISTVANVQGMLEGLTKALESGSTESESIKKQFEEIERMMVNFEGVDFLKKKIEELGATIETALTKEDIEKAIQNYTSKITMYSEKVANEQDAMLKEYYTKQLVGYLTNLENSYTKLMELTGEDYSKQIKNILDQLAKYQPSTAKVTDVEQLRRDIAQYETLVSKYKNDIAQATTDTMRTYYTGLLQSTLSSLVKSYETLGNITGESFKEQIEGLLKESEALQVKPSTAGFDVQKAWENVKKTLEEVATLEETAAKLGGTEAQDFYEASLQGLRNVKSTLLDIAKADPTQDIAPTLATVNEQIANINDKLKTQVDLESKLRAEIEQYGKKANEYRSQMAKASTDVMKTYYSGLLQSTLNAMVKDFQTLMDETGKDYTAEIEKINNEIRALQTKPQTETAFNIEEAWKNVEKTLVEVENLQKLVTETGGKEARDLLNASLSSLNNVKNTLIDIGKAEPTKDVTTKLLEINMLIDRINGKVQELNKMDFMSSLVDFYAQFTELVQSGQLETALELLQATVKSANELGVALDFSKLEPAVFGQYGKVLEQMRTDMDGAKEKAKELLKTVLELATMSGLESFQNLASALDLITKKTSQATGEVSVLGVELGKTATESEQAFQLILNLLGTYLTQLETYLAEGTDSAMENARVTMVMIENELKKLKDAGVKVPEAFQNAWESAMNRLTSAENTYNARLEEANQKRLEELEKQKQKLLEQAKLYNGIKNELASMFTQFGEVGRLIQAILEEIDFQVVQLEDGSYQLINPFEDLTSVIENVNKLLEDTNIRADVIVWSIQQIGNALTNIIEDFKAVFEPAPEKQTGQTLNYAKTLENWKNYDENVKKLKALQTQLALTETAATVSMGTIGALIGSLLGGPLGALLGGALGVLGGQAIGEATTEEVRKQIEELQAQLKVTFQELASALGTSIDSVASALERAFSADTYEEFLNNFSDSLEDMTKTALIRAFLASDTMQPLLENLSNAITLAVMDGVLSPEELEVLKQLESQVTDAAKPFFDALIQLFPPTTVGTGTIENQTVGGIVRSSISEQTGGMLVGLMNSLNLVTQDIRDILKNGTVNVYVVNATDYAKYSTESGR